MLRDVQRDLVRGLLDETPVKGVEPDGFRLASLLVAKLRFERAIRGDNGLEAWFDRDAQGFSKAFKRYIREMPPLDYFPRQEAEAFRRWMQKNGIPENPGPQGAS